MLDRTPAILVETNPEPSPGRVQLWPAFLIRRDEAGRFLAVATIDVHGVPSANGDEFTIEIAQRSVVVAVGAFKTTQSFATTPLVLLPFAMIVDGDVIYRVKRRLARAVIPEILFENRTPLGPPAAQVPSSLQSYVLAILPPVSKRAGKRVLSMTAAIGKANPRTKPKPATKREPTPRKPVARPRASKLRKTS